jgi:hypothetical protein
MSDWTTLDELPEGAIFETRDGIRAVKSEYHLTSGKVMCILLASGEYLHAGDVAKHNALEVREVTADEAAIRAAVEEERAPLLALLSSLEWSGERGAYAHSSCPSCHGDAPLEGVTLEMERERAAKLGREPYLGGHNEGCRLAAALAGRG